MSEQQDNSQERTLEPTPKRREDAKKKGQIARSKEFTTMVVLLAGTGSMLVLGNGLLQSLSELLVKGFTLDRAFLFQKGYLLHQVGFFVESFIWMMLPLFFVLMVAALASGFMVGGLGFSFQALKPKFSKLNPIKGLKRVFSVKSLMELVKAFAKFAVVCAMVVLLLWLQIDNLFFLDQLPTKTGIIKAIGILGWSFLAMSATLIFIVAVDVPFQLFQHQKQLKMTHQEMKDEMKNAEGKPEVKAKVRQLQREMTERRMMGDVPDADVIITNPTHFAVALKYDQAGDKAPILLAKGADQIAFKIREVGGAHDVPTLELPSLARALYHTTEIGGEIHGGLFVAVAQVLAYVYQLRQFKARQAKRPRALRDDFDLPDEFQF